MQGVELFRQYRGAVGLQLGERRGHRQFIALTEVAHIRVIENPLLLSRDALLLQPAGRLGAQPFEYFNDLGRGDTIQGAEDGPGEFFPVVATHVAHCT